MDELERIDKGEMKKTEIAEASESNGVEDTRMKDREGDADAKVRGSNRTGVCETWRPCGRRHDHGFRNGGEGRSGRRFRPHGAKCEDWRRNDDRPREGCGHSFDIENRDRNNCDRPNAGRSHSCHGHGCGNWRSGSESPRESRGHGFQGMRRGEWNRNDDHLNEGCGHGFHGHGQGCVVGGAHGRGLR